MALLHTFLLDGALLHGVKRSGDQHSLHACLADVSVSAVQSLAHGPYSVMSKTFVPPSGNKHDYVSMGPYWWPNPDTADGLPYIRKDGQVNPENAQFDGRKFANLRDHIHRLAVSYYYTGNEEFAAYAIKLLTTWFLDPTTKMNPHLNYGQMIPGICDGRAVGVIDTWALGYLLDDVVLLETSTSWSQPFDQELKDWFRHYLNWLRTSEIALKEEKARNNHGTFYDVQTAAIALHVGERETATEILTMARERRVEKQIRADGSQPHELERTLSLFYSIFNLNGLLDLAMMAEKVGINLYSDHPQDAGHIRDAIDFLLPYLEGKKKWTFEQIGEVPAENIFKLMRRAANLYGDPQYETVAHSLEQSGEISAVTRLSFPASMH